MQASRKGEKSLEVKKLGAEDEYWMENPLSVVCQIFHSRYEREQEEEREQLVARLEFSSQELHHCGQLQQHSNWILLRGRRKENLKSCVSHGKKYFEKITCEPVERIEDSI